LGKIVHEDPSPSQKKKAGHSRNDGKLKIGGFAVQASLGKK
jgi:hypothetical protein